MSQESQQNADQVWVSFVRLKHSTCQKTKLTTTTESRTCRHFCRFIRTKRLFKVTRSHNS